MADDWRVRAQKQGFRVRPMRPIPTQLPDGGRIEVTDADIVPMGDAFAYRQLTYSHDGDAKRPACNIVLEVRKRTPICASVQLWSSSERGIHAEDLAAMKLDDLRDALYAFAGVFIRNPDGGWVRKLGPASFKQDRKGVQNVTRRRTVTSELLSQVAEVYQAAPERGRTAAVKAAFCVSQRQALRYISEAKRRGLVND